MRMNYYKIIISLIFVTFLVTGCAQPGKKVKGFKHNTPLIAHCGGRKTTLLFMELDQTASHAA